MDTIALARSLRGSIGMLAMDWLMAPATLAAAADRGMPSGLPAYAVGRFGVLGACPVDVVIGTAFFWEPSLLRGVIEEGRAGIEPAAGGRIYAAICADWGEERLADFDGCERLGELLEPVVAAASPLGAPLFAAWRAHVDASPGPGRTFQLAQTMRELRFSRHCVAVQAAGMSPLEAILSGPSGEWNAEMFGWPKPYPDVSGLTDRREEIENHTDRLHAPDLEVLTAEERGELRVLAKTARAHAAGSG